MLFEIVLIIVAVYLLFPRHTYHKSSRRYDFERDAKTLSKKNKKRLNQLMQTVDDDSTIKVKCKNGKEYTLAPKKDVKVL